MQRNVAAESSSSDGIPPYSFFENSTYSGEEYHPPPFITLKSFGNG